MDRAYEYTPDSEKLAAARARIAELEELCAALHDKVAKLEKAAAGPARTAQPSRRQRT